MSPELTLTDATYSRLLRLGGELFSPAEVIERLLDRVEDSQPSRSGPVTRRPDHQTAAPPKRGLEHRPPRQRGATVRLGDTTIRAASVRDLFEKAMEYLVAEGGMARIEHLIPLKTSNQRYLIARQPIHPTGQPFVAPAEYGGYYMEAHKNYRNAVSGLALLAKRAGIEIEYQAESEDSI